MFGGNAGTAIAYGKFRTAGIAPPLQNNLAAGRGIAHSVSHQIGKSAEQLALGAVQVALAAAFAGNFVTTAGKRLRITLHGSFNARPWATNLRTVVL